MISSLLLAAALWPATATQHCVPSEQNIIVGVAYNPEGEFLYCELISKPNDKTIEIDYTRNQKIFARKKLSYGNNPLMPEVKQKDERSGELRQTENKGQELIIQYQPNSHKKMATATFSIDQADIVDAGFDNYIRKSWEDLSTGQILSVNFASIAHQKVLPLRISARPLEKCQAQAAEKEQASCFFVEIDNAFLRLLLGNIKLVYDQHHRLQKFDGVVNINDDKESTQHATIYYFYQQDYSQ